MRTHNTLAALTHEAQVLGLTVEADDLMHHLVLTKTQKHARTYTSCSPDARSPSAGPGGGGR